MKYIKSSVFALLAVIIAVCLQGCVEPDTGKYVEKNSNKPTEDVIFSTGNRIDFLYGGECAVYVQNSQVTYLSGNVTEFEQNSDFTAAAYVMDGYLYVNCSGRTRKVAQCSKVLDMSDYGTGVAYTSDGLEIKLYNAKNDTITSYTLPNVVSDQTHLTLSPDGSAFAYYDEVSASLYLCRNAEQIAIAQNVSVSEIHGVAANGALIYVSENSLTTMYCYTDSGERNQIWEHSAYGGGAYSYREFNLDKTQILFHEGTNTYISENGQSPVLFAEGNVEPIYPDGAYGVADLYGSLYKDQDKGTIMIIERDSSVNCVLLSNKDAVGNSYNLETNEYLTYENHLNELRRLRISDREQACENSNLIWEIPTGEVKACSYYLSPGMNDVYYIGYSEQDGEGKYALYHDNGSSTKEIAEMHEQSAWSDMVRISLNGKGVYYSTADALYYYDGSDCILLDENPYVFLKGNYMYVARYIMDFGGYPEKTDKLYLIQENHKLERIFATEFAD
jgi:hypothetical protein